VAATFTKPIPLLARGIGAKKKSIEEQANEDFKALETAVYQPDAMLTAAEALARSKWSKTSNADERLKIVRDAYQHATDERFYLVVVFNGYGQVEDFLKQSELLLDEGLYMDGRELAAKLGYQLRPDVPIKPQKSPKERWAALAD
jgi:hypothetical protein